MKLAAVLAALLLAGCGRYGNFTLPPLAGGDANLSFTFEERPEPLLTANGDALNPSVVEFGGAQVMLYSLFDGVWRTATPRETVLSPDPRTWESGYIAANGTALGDGSTLRYWYVAGKRNRGRIGLATSTDARRFERHGAPVLENGPFLSWDERAVADPYVIRAGGWYYMYYLGQDRAEPPQQRLGLAHSQDGVRWEKLIANPILSPGPPGSFDEAGVGEPAVWSYGGYYWMLFTGRDFSERRRLGLARSTDGVTWTRLPSVFSGASAWDSKVICDPTVVVNGNQIDVWFGGGDVASPDENLHGKIGFGVLRPVHAAEAK
jgi:predicted GH43/DUF377 family glycosyl hydrolase